jgi:cobalamin 5'-phosphate synthase/cobalamin synthase
VRGVRRLVCAIAFLTRVPVPARWQFDARDVGRATLAFPLVGAMLGALAVALRHALGPALPPEVVALLIVCAAALVTGALHLDGLADMADGFGGGRTREDVLRIMRDHVIGAYGGCALVLAIGLKSAAIAALVARGADAALVIAPMIARWTTAAVGAAIPYARAHAGLGRAITGHVGRTEVVGATVLTALGAIGLGGAVGALAWAAAAAMSALQAAWCVRRIGGVTGDTLGANVEVCEVLVYVIAVALW